jgi:nucleoside-diphosphate-sugar epimerase
MHHFITGAAGFIGSQLVDSLLDSRHHVSGVDDL